MPIDSMVSPPPRQFRAGNKLTKLYIYLGHLLLEVTAASETHQRAPTCYHAITVVQDEEG